MSALKVVLLAIDLATRQRDEAGKLLRQIRQTSGHAMGQMQQLESYAADTESKWAVSSRTVCSVEILRHYDQFMDRLQHAIILQRNIVNGLEQEITVARQVLLQAEVRIANLNRLLEKKQAGIYRQQSVREQKELDELSALQYRRLRADHDTLETS